MVLSFTGEQCDVTPYTNDYQPITNVQVVNAVTAFTDESTGVTSILHFNQVLWYGNRMKMSLLNPTQLRHFGIAVSDDPSDNTRPFGISGDDLFIPFLMDGTTVYFETRVPTEWELENCKHVEMKDDSLWNPSQVTISNVTSTQDLPLVEVLPRRNILSLHVMNKALSNETYNDLTSYDEARFLNRMIGNVNVATAHRDLNVYFMESKDRHSQVNAETVARKFRCGIETAQRTLKTTSHTTRCSSNRSSSDRRYRVDHLNLHKHRLDDTFYMDTLFSKVKSLNGHTCAQCITTGTFTRIYPMESKASRNIAQALTEFADDVGIPGTLICDLASEQTGKNSEVLKTIRRLQIRLLPAEKGRGTTQNHRAETEICEVKTKWKTRMRENQVPARLWDYGLVYIAEVQLLLARGPDQCPGIKKVMSQTVDISEWLDFSFCDRVWY
jgi:hypothetical protein